MTSPEDAAPVKPPPSFAPGAPIAVQKSRFSGDPLQSSGRISADLGDTTPVASPTFSPRPSSLSPSRRFSSSTQLRRSSAGSPVGGIVDGSDDVRSLIIRAFSPAVAILASDDTHELVKQKGFKGGFRELLRPFGEKVPGRVVIRDSVGSSRGWEDYGVRLIDLAETQPVSSSRDPVDSAMGQLEAVLQNTLDAADSTSNRWSQLSQSPATNSLSASPLYQLFLRRLLCVNSPTPHETFMHPVACVIAISSRNKTPLESLRQLYAQTSQGSNAPPPWVHGEFLRYYVLVHDEDRDDIGESTKLYDQMKRHFGLHCHLLRLRSNQCVETDDDSVEVPSTEWLSPAEDLSKAEEKNVLIDFGTEVPYLFESDVNAIKMMVRELVVQSVIPFMENKVAIWNDQVASRRRGLSGRFMSMSRRWAGFGSSKSGSSGLGGGNTGNYDPSLGCYRPDTPEAILRKLADYAFMLRDWKLSASTYDLIRADYGNDKAWKYHAGAHEMCAVSMLLNPLASNAKNKLETIDQLIETACYSYLTRCSAAENALRCLTLSVELLMSRGGSAAESAARWAMRIMEMGLVGPIGRNLITERISACYASKTSNARSPFGSRRRKAAMWSVLASDAWLKLGKTPLALVCLEQAERLYAEVLDKEGIYPIPEMQAVMDNLKRAVQVEYLEAQGVDTSDETEVAKKLGAEETSEKLDDRAHRWSLIVTPAMVESGPPSAVPQGEEPRQDDDFE